MTKNDYISEFESESSLADAEEIQKELKEKDRKENFSAMLAESLKSGKKRFSVGDKVKAEVLVVGKEDVFVSVGPQQDGVVSRRDLLNESNEVTCKVGDTLNLYVTFVKGSEIKLSSQPTSKNLADDIEDAFDQLQAIEGRVVEVCKGGFRVQIKSVLAFCPISQMDRVHITAPEEYVGKRFEFRITQFSEKGRNVVVSRRKLLDEEQEVSQAAFLTEHRAGDVVSGTVKRLEKFGAFVEVAPGTEGLLHVSEMAWSRVNDPSELLTVGQTVQVKVLKIENDGAKTKISLSIKQTLDRPAVVNPYEKSAGGSELAVGSIVKGKVDKREPFGLFIKLSEGVTGLLHKSKAYEYPEFGFDKLKVGDEVTVQIAEIRAAERRISLEVPRDPDADEWRNYVAPTTEKSGGMGTLGGAWGSALQNALQKKNKK